MSEYQLWDFYETLVSEARFLRLLSVLLCLENNFSFLKITKYNYLIRKSSYDTKVEK